MISYLKGKVVLARWGVLIVETGGVGHKVIVSPQIEIKPNIVDLQEPIELFVHEHIREDADDLYGFISYEELELFERLISVNGVGPKAGMAIMSSGKADEIVRAIISDNLGFFTAISGIGKKAAAKIILDLKSKLSGDRSVNILSGDSASEDLTEALQSLGYKQAEIMSVIGKIPSTAETLEDKMKCCLKNLAK
ncbi:MAG: Holliday junction branch migration protein RuvA [Candidatus Berkelbacteria bacterium]